MMQQKTVASSPYIPEVGITIVLTRMYPYRNFASLGTPW